ncbi:hypothetical protein [Streptomyces sp. NPDC058665]|uniref:hypothetical protein n=1 Tax=Streptomyces sp. NPDC058665 TaxID=3346586 RepID=UPI00364E9CD6
MASEHLLAHSGTEFGPVAIGKGLGRFSGAVANALTKLTGNGTVAQTSERPVLYAAVRSDTTDEP